MTDYKGVDMGKRTGRSPGWRGTVAERMWRKVNKAGRYNPVTLGGRSAVMDTRCWEWTGHIGPDGYGRMSADGPPPKLVHRVSYGLVASIPDGYVIDHLCRNRRCVNPDHLEATTQGVNIQRQGLQPKNTSGYRNVTWDGRRRKWYVRVRSNGVSVYGGGFDDIGSAAARAEDLRSSLHG